MIWPNVYVLAPTCYPNSCSGSFFGNAMCGYKHTFCQSDFGSRDEQINQLSNSLFLNYNYQGLFLFSSCLENTYFISLEDSTVGSAFVFVVFSLAVGGL